MTCSKFALAAMPFILGLLIGCSSGNTASPEAPPDAASPETAGHSGSEDIVGTVVRFESGDALVDVTIDRDSSASRIHAGTTSHSELTQMPITVGSKVFVATLHDNATARAFGAMLPLRLNMTELNANEKFHDLPHDLPTAATKLGAIHAGDLMLYGSKTVVLFYKSFSTQYSYTPIGKLVDASGLAASLGTGKITVTFEPALLARAASGQTEPAAPSARGMPR